MTRITAATAVAIGLFTLVAGCSDPQPSDPTTTPSPGTAATGTPPPATTSPPPPPGSSTPAPRDPMVGPDDADPATALAAVDHLAGEIGPRPGTSPAYFEAAAWVQERLEAAGWTVTRQRFHTPAGVSWGEPVEGGDSVNLVATRAERAPGRPWVLVGAHLDTVPLSPGAEDNASGVGALLAVAEALADHRARRPVTLVVFGSEEPRGPTDADHHYGSRAYVAALTETERRSLRGMVSLDRVGVGEVLPVGSAERRGPVAPQLLAAARRAGVPTVEERDERSSDHWSFAREGLPAARLGSTPYAGYHSPDDVAAVVSSDQLDRAIRTALAWLGR